MTMLRITIAAVILALGTPALAQQRLADARIPSSPVLKRDITVARDLVRIGDLVDNAGAAANVAVFRAPDLGDTGYVPVQRVVEALRPFNIVALDTGGLSEIAVTRASRAIPVKEIEARIAQALMAPSGWRDVKSIGV